MPPATACRGTVDGRPCSNKAITAKRGLCRRHQDHEAKLGLDLPARFSAPRVPEPCGAEGCDAAAVRRGQCDKHYRQMLRKERGQKGVCRAEGCRNTAVSHSYCRPHEDLVLPPFSLAHQLESWLAKATGFEPATGCWPYVGQVSAKMEYGRVHWARRQWLVHRLSYVYFIGGHQDSVELDHLCNVKLCCNPVHLSPATKKKNRRLQEVRRENPQFIDQLPTAADQPRVLGNRVFDQLSSDEKDARLRHLVTFSYDRLRPLGRTEDRLGRHIERLHPRDLLA